MKKPQWVGDLIFILHSSKRQEIFILKITAVQRHSRPLQGAKGIISKSQAFTSQNMILRSSQIQVVNWTFTAWNYSQGQVYMSWWRCTSQDVFIIPKYPSPTDVIWHEPLHTPIARSTLQCNVLPYSHEPGYVLHASLFQYIEYF